MLGRTKSRGLGCVIKDPNQEVQIVFIENTQIESLDCVRKDPIQEVQVVF